jgi:hypothetical protein
MRTHYGPWQPCWISNQHQKQKSCIWPSSEHFWQVWLISVQRFQRRRFKCEKLTDGRTTDAYQWQKFTWPMARRAKNQPYTAQLHMAYDIPTRFHKVWSRHLREIERTKMCGRIIIIIVKKKRRIAIRHPTAFGVT